MCLQSPRGEKKSVLKGQQTKNATSQDLSMGQTLNVTAHEDPAAKAQQNYCNPWTVVKNKLLCF